MKGAIASYLIAVKNFLDIHRNFDGTISLIITSDEEGKAKFGTQKVVDWMLKNKSKIDFCIVGEPTNPRKVGEIAKIGRRGSMNCQLTVTGRQGHVAYPENATNPIPDLIKYIEILKKPFDKGNENFQPSNLEITSIDTGNTTVNLIPQKILTRFNIRFNNHFSSESLKKNIKDRLDSVGKNYSIKYEVSGEPFLKKSIKYNNFLKESVFEITGNNLRMDTSGGTSDARFISKICPVVEFGSVGKTMHQVDEYANIKDLETLSKIYLRFLEKVFQ